MSIHAVSWALKTTGLTPSEKLILIALANYADEDGICWPSMNRLAEETSITRRTVIRGLERLERRKLIVREKRLRDNGSHTSNIYRLVMGGDNLSLGSDSIVSPGVVTSCHQGGDLMSHPEPSIEPSIRKDSTSFDEFWSAYPRKVGKGQARKAYNTALKTTDAATLLTAVQRIPKPEDLEFFPHASTWLNGERWLDETGPPVVAQTSKDEIKARIEAAREARESG